MNKLTIKTCPLCGNNHLEHKITCKDFYVSKEEFELVSCHKCGFVFTQNFPVESEIGAYYNTPNYISHSNTKKGIMNILYHIARIYRLRKKATFVIKESHLKKGKILDIGTGTGYFPNTMQKRGWEVSAIEKSEIAREFAAKHFKLNVFEDIAQAPFKANSFDVVSLWHVMEHLANLDECWEKINEWLTPQGVLIVAVPNCASYDAAHYKEYWAAYDVPRHLWHFTPNTIQQWASKHHFILSGRYPMPLDAFYISILSEKYMQSRIPLLKGAWLGFKAWLHTLNKKEQSSSMLYVFRKKISHENL